MPFNKIITMQMSVLHVLIEIQLYVKYIIPLNSNYKMNMNIKTNVRQLSMRLLYYSNRMYIIYSSDHSNSAQFLLKQ